MTFKWPTKQTWWKIGGVSLVKSLIIATVILVSSAHAGTPLFILDKDNQLIGTYQVEIARTPEQREKGLMFRKSLAKGSGMLFSFDKPERGIKMWMKNTLIPLDMLFADVDGKVVYIQRNAIPHDLTPLGPDSAVAVGAVLELPAGTVEQAGLEIGDRLAIHNQ